MVKKPTTPPQAFSDLLRSAVQEPGTLSTAYRQFHHYCWAISSWRCSSATSVGCNPGRSTSEPAVDQVTQ